MTKAFTRIGILGCGQIVSQVHLPVLKALDGVQIEWLCDKRIEQAKKLAALFNIKNFFDCVDDLSTLPKVDVLLLATPAGFRLPFLKWASTQGIAVFSEKPLAINSGLHRTFVSYFPNAKLVCGYMRRAYLNQMMIQEMIRDRWFGNIHEIHYSEGGRGTATGVSSSHYDNKEASGGGILLSLGCHGLDSILQSVSPISYNVEEARIISDAGIDRHVETRIKFLGSHKNETNQCIVDFCVSWLKEQPNHIEYVFDNVVVSTGLSPEAKVQIYPRGKRQTQPMQLNERLGVTNSYAAFATEWIEFLQGLRDAKPSRFDASTSLICSELIDSIYRAGLSNTVEIAQLGLEGAQ